MFLYIKNILQLLLAPSRGWEDVSVSVNDIPTLERRLLYPSIGLAALSVFFRLIYHNGYSVPALIVSALVVFVSFFVTYFFAVMMYKSFFYRFCEGDTNEHKIKVVIAYSICLLAISEVVCNLMPVNLGLKYLLPLAVAMIMWKADVYLRVRNDMNFYYIIFAILVVIVPPMVIQAAFSYLK